MTLREKFEVVLVFTLSRELHNEKCEKIADDYAIEFAEWLKDKPRSQFNRESLELFKKEKGL
jgi:hypothetical protein